MGIRKYPLPGGDVDGSKVVYPLGLGMGMGMNFYYGDGDGIMIPVPAPLPSLILSQTSNVSLNLKNLWCMTLREAILKIFPNFMSGVIENNTIYNIM